MEFWGGASFGLLGASKPQGNQLQSGLILKLFPSLQTHYAVEQHLSWFVSKGLHSTPSISLHTAVIPLYIFSLSSPSPFHFGGNVIWKEVKYLGRTFDGAGNRTLDHWPPHTHPRPKMRPPMRILTIPRAASQNCALGRFCLLEHRALLHGRGFPLFSCLPLPLPARRASLDQV